jgi:hypothetical protein
MPLSSLVEAVIRKLKTLKAELRARPHQQAVRPLVKHQRQVRLAARVSRPAH